MYIFFGFVTAFDSQNFMRLWKGLFYSMWMSDKPLPQEELAESIASLVHSFGRPEISIQYFSSFLKTMSIEWFGIDQWRIDKFMMLVRRSVRQMFVLLHKHNWNETLIDQLNEEISQTVMKSSGSIGFFMHFTELYIEEVAKVSGGSLPVSSVTALIKPFATYIAKPRDPKLAKHAIKHVFTGLLFQSELGREYQEKFEAWKELGFPGTSIDELEKFEEEEEADDEEDVGDEEDEYAEVVDDESGADTEEDAGEQNGVQHLDPRAGRVDVVMPILPFDAQEIIGVLEEEKYKKYTKVKTRHLISRVVNHYSTFASGKFPLGIQTIKRKADDISLPKIDDKVNEIVNFERKLYAQNEPLKQLSKRNRKKFLAGKAVPTKKAAKHTHSDDGGCCEHDHGTPKKRRSITPAEKQKINQWQEEDIVVAAEEQTPVKSPTESAKKRKNKDRPKNESPKVHQKNGEANSPAKVKPTPSKSPAAFSVDPWDVPLEEGEIEFTTKSRKHKLAEISELAAQSFATKSVEKKVVNPVALAALRGKLSKTPTPVTPCSATPSTTAPVSSGEKRVKIVLKNNRSQETSEYLQQLRNSPNTPYDANKKPSKGLLKPNLMPSPINPYYKKKLGLNFD